MLFDTMFNCIFNWIAKIRTKRQLLKLYYMLLEKRTELVCASNDRYNKYYHETRNISDAIAYILYTKFNCHNYNIAWHYEHIDTDIQEYIDNILESDKENHCAIDKAIEALSDSIYEWDGYRFVKYY